MRSQISVYACIWMHYVQTHPSGPAFCVKICDLEKCIVEYVPELTTGRQLKPHDRLQVVAVLSKS